MSRRRVVTLLGVFLLSYAGLCGLTYSQQARLIFFPTREVRLTPADFGMPFRELSLTSRDGTRLHGWSIPSAEPSDLWVLHCHGNGGNISHRLQMAALFHKLGLNCVLFDYRGYGKSEGALPSESQLYEDGQAFYDELKDRRVVLYGESLGGGVATALAAQREPVALVLQSTFSSLKRRAAEAYPFLPVRLLSRYDLDSLRRVAALGCPKLIMHSQADEVIGFPHGRALFEGAREPKQWVEIHGGHNAPALDEVEQALRGFLGGVKKV